VTLFSVYLGKEQEPVAVADRFSWPAALFPFFYALWHRLWLMLAVWIVLVSAVAAFGTYGGEDLAVALGALVALFFGFEGPAFRRGKLARRFPYLGEAVARDRDQAALSLMSRP